MGDKLLLVFDELRSLANLANIGHLDLSSMMD